MVLSPMFLSAGQRPTRAPRQRAPKFGNSSTPAPLGPKAHFTGPILTNGQALWARAQSMVVNDELQAVKQPDEIRLPNFTLQNAQGDTVASVTVFKEPQQKLRIGFLSNKAYDASGTPKRDGMVYVDMDSTGRLNDKLIVNYTFPSVVIERTVPVTKLDGKIHSSSQAKGLGSTTQDLVVEGLKPEDREAAQAAADLFINRDKSTGITYFDSYSGAHHCLAQQQPQ